MAEATAIAVAQPLSWEAEMWNFEMPSDPACLAAEPRQRDAWSSRFRRCDLDVLRVKVADAQTEALHHRFLRRPPCCEPLRVAVGVGTFDRCPPTVKECRATLGNESVHLRDGYDINPGAYDAVTTFSQRRGFES